MNNLIRRPIRRPMYQSYMIDNNLQVKPITEANLHQLLELQGEVISQLEVKDLYRYTSYESYIEFIRFGAIIIGLYHEDTLIAFGALLKPFTYDPQLLDADVFYNIDKSKVFYFRAVAIKKAYRGKGLHMFIVDYLEKEAIILGGSHMIVNVHPDNEVSKNNFKKLGYQFYRDIYLENQYLRRFYFKELC